MFTPDLIAKVFLFQIRDLALFFSFFFRMASTVHTSADMPAAAVCVCVAHYLFHFSTSYTSVSFQIVGLGAYVIASAFFSVFNMGVDTLFLSFRKFVTLSSISVNRDSNNFCVV